MMCYRDTTFCVSPACANACGRKLTKETITAAEKWWKGVMGHDYSPNTAPIAVSNFCGGDLEEGYKKIFGESTDA